MPNPTEAASSAEKLLSQGEPLLAYDALSEALSATPGDLRLRQLLALSLLRSGASRAAGKVLLDLVEEGHADAETLGLLARVYKDQAREAVGEGRVAFERQAQEAYLRAFRLTGDPWPGINAASLALLLDHPGDARALAAEVQRGPPAGDSYWHTATLAEAALVVGDWDRALELYAKAHTLGAARYADIASTRGQARRVAGHLRGAEGARLIEEALPLPAVGVFTGHMIDQPGRATPRFPPEREDEARGRIRALIARLPIRVGFASLACGADILFLEAVLEVGGDVHVVLPYSLDAFIGDSVAIIPGGDWEARCRRIVDKARSVFVVSEQPLRIGGVVYEYANTVLLGAAAIRARQLDTVLLPVALWDGRPGDGAAGTEATVQDWRRRGHAVHVIDLPGKGGDAEPRRREPSRRVDAELRGIMLLDTVRFSGLDEEQIPAYVEHVLGGIARLVANVPYAPLVCESRGDGCFLVFAGASDAGRFALDLVDRMAAMDWAAVGLPPGLAFRIGLHAGPVFLITDPLTRLRTYTGSHVVRAARIEPVTPPGQVYASEGFAAMAAADGVTSFACDYVGRTTLAKTWGRAPIYALRRQAPA